MGSHAKYHAHLILTNHYPSCVVFLGNQVCAGFRGFVHRPFSPWLHPCFASCSSALGLFKTVNDYPKIRVACQPCGAGSVISSGIVDRLQ